MIFSAAANETTVAPGAVQVSPDSSDSGVSYFSFEATQLTPDVIANLTALNLTGIEYFDFANTSSSSTTTKRGYSASCKTLPGDAAWPPHLVWSVLDLLLGGALIKSVPVAAPCYSDWAQYDPDQCSTITAQWNSPQFQYFPFHPSLILCMANGKDHLNPPASTGPSSKA